MLSIFVKFVYYFSLEKSLDFLCEDSLWSMNGCTTDFDGFLFFLVSDWFVFKNWIVLSIMLSFYFVLFGNLKFPSYDGVSV